MFTTHPTTPSAAYRSVLLLLSIAVALGAAAAHASTHEERFISLNQAHTVDEDTSSDIRSMPAAGAALQQLHRMQQQRPHVQLIRRSLAADNAAEASSADAPAMPVYGNWCGPNYGSGTPIDELDSCCREHDMCYDSTAVYNHCNCDKNLVQCLHTVDVQSHHLRKRAMRAAIVAYFDNTACRCSKHTGMCMPIKSCFCPADSKQSG